MPRRTTQFWHFSLPNECQMDFCWIHHFLTTPKHKFYRNNVILHGWKYSECAHKKSDALEAVMSTCWKNYDKSDIAYKELQKCLNLFLFCSLEKLLTAYSLTNGSHPTQVEKQCAFFVAKSLVYYQIFFITLLFIWYVRSGFFFRERISCTTKNNEAYP